MVKAYSAIANGGIILQPFIEKKVVNSEGVVLRERRGINQGRVFQPETCEQVRHALGEVVKRGTAQPAQSELYTIGGKTGTTEKLVAGRYVKNKNIGSFVGMAPLEKPRLVVMIMMDEPQGVSFGGMVAAPVARRVLEDGLRYLQVQPNSKEDKDSKEVKPPKIAQHPKEVQQSKETQHPKEARYLKEARVSKEVHP